MIKVEKLLKSHYNKKIEEDWKSSSFVNKKNRRAAFKYFKKTVDCILGITCEKIVFYLTQAESINFMFFTDEIYDIKVCLDVFYTKDDETDTDAVYTIYKNDKAIVQVCGKLDFVFKKLEEDIERIETEIEENGTN